MNFEDELERRFTEYLAAAGLDEDPPRLVKDSLPMLFNVVDMIAPVLVEHEGPGSLYYVSACLRALADSVDAGVEAAADAAVKAEFPTHITPMCRCEYLHDGECRAVTVKEG